MPGKVSRKTKLSRTNRTLERQGGGTVWRRTGSGSAVATDGSGRVVRPRGPAQPKSKSNKDDE